MKSLQHYIRLKTLTSLKNLRNQAIQAWVSLSREEGIAHVKPLENSLFHFFDPKGLKKTDHNTNTHYHEITPSDGSLPVWQIPPQRGFH